MSRIYIGICILLLLAICSISSLWMPKIHLDISRQLEQAAYYAQSEDWQQATDHAKQAAKAWQDVHDLTAVAVDHGPAEQIDALFAELEIYASQREMPDFAATALHLSRLTAAMGNNHGFSWWNLL